VVKSSEGTLVQEAAMKVAAAQIYELLMNYDPNVLKARLKEGDTSDYAKLVNSIVRIGDGGLKQERYRDEVAEREARKEEAKRGGLTKEELENIERDLNLL
jgi:hypothetical protein